MKTNRLLSALLAVMMVISMIACIALPAVAETLPADAVHISTITEKVTTGRNIYLEAPADFVTLANAHANKYLFYLDTIYLKNDIDMSTYVSPTEGNAFKDDYTPMTYNKSGAVNWNGLGHTIYNWNEDSSIYGEYGFENNVGAPTSIDVSVKNLNMAGATITGGVGAVLLAKANADSGYGGNILIENCHVYNCNASSAANYYTAGLIGRVDGDQRVNIIIRNCSVIGNNFSVNPASETAKTEANGLFIGRAECNEVTIENSIAANNTIGKLTAAATNSSGGLAIGDAKYCYGGYTFNNVALINNTIEVLGDCYDALLVNPYNTATDIVASNIYAVGNVKSTDSAGTADDVPVKAWVNDSANKNGVVTLTNCISDGATYDVYTSLEDCVVAPVERIVPNLTVETVLNEMNSNVATDNLYWKTDATYGFAGQTDEIVSYPTATFVFSDKTILLTADSTGKVAIDAETKGILAAESWETEGAAATIDFDNLVITADTVYTASSHELSYVGNGDKTHNVTCSGCTEHAAASVPCTPVAVPENDVAAGFFNKGETAYKCEFCSNTWTEEATESTYEAPFSVAFDAESYKNNDATVKVTVTPKTEAAMSGLELTLNVNEYLDYVSFESVANVAVNEVSEGTIAIAFVDEAALVAEDAVVLTFVTKGLSDSAADVDLTVSATATRITVGNGNDLAEKAPLTGTASAAADAIYLSFKAGDVNKDEVVNLIDAVLLVQKLNGTIGSDFDATFKLIAADVDASGEVNTADLTLILQYIVQMDVTLVQATNEPTIVVVA